MRQVLFTLLLLVLGSAFCIQNCTVNCPLRGDMCWDTSVETGNCTTTGPVYSQLVPAQDCSKGCWRLVSMIYEGNAARSGNNHNIYVQMVYENGTYVTSGPNGPWWTAFWGSAWNQHDGQQSNLSVLGASGYGNFPVWASEPDWTPSTCHCPGPYGAFAGSDMTVSDVFYGAGMPVHFHVNWVLIWRWAEEFERVPMTSD